MGWKRAKGTETKDWRGEERGSLGSLGDHYHPPPHTDLHTDRPSLLIQVLTGSRLSTTIVATVYTHPTPSPPPNAVRSSWLAGGLEPCHYGSQQMNTGGLLGLAGEHLPSLSSGKQQHRREGGREGGRGGWERGRNGQKERDGWRGREGWRGME